MRQLFTFAFVLGLLTAHLPSTACGHQGVCAGCGCTTNCCQVCRLVCDEKKVEVVCWGCDQEKFCAPGPSQPGCRHCQCVCGTCDKDEKPSTTRSLPKPFVWFDWLPSFADCYTRTKLMKKTVTVTVPSHKWVVEDLCAACRADRAADQDVKDTLPPPAGKGK